MAELLRGKVVLPILIGRTVLPHARGLPPDLTTLHDHQARVIDSVSWRSVIDEVTLVIEEHLGLTRGSSGRPSARSARPRSRATVAHSPPPVRRYRAAMNS